MNPLETHTYFSHSYRLVDQDYNSEVWEEFEKQGFFLSVDPPSNSTIHAHLERMMNRSSCYVAVFNRRKGTPYEFSPFILYEYGLAVQARLPMLILIDRDLGNRWPFKTLREDEKYFFSGDLSQAGRKDLTDKIKKLKKRALPRREWERRPIGLVLPKTGRNQAYGGGAVRNKIARAAQQSGFEFRELVTPYEHNIDFSFALEECEAIVLDVSCATLPPWIFAYTHGRLIPSIKLAQVSTRQLHHQLAVPPMVNALKMDSREPGVESLTYWRDSKDLVYQLNKAFSKLDEEPTQLRSKNEGTNYFKSIGRRPARVFISNGSKANLLAGQLSELFRRQNIERFQYKDEKAIKTHADWRETIEHELEICQVFVALIGPGYTSSKWCQKEIALALKREEEGGLVIRTYNLGGITAKDLSDLGLDKPQVTQLPRAKSRAANLVFEDVDTALKQPDEASWLPGQPLMLGGSNEAVVDALRHLPAREWNRVIDNMRGAGIEVGKRQPGKTPRSRKLADEVLLAAQRSLPPTGGKKKIRSTLGFLVDQVIPGSASSRKPVLKKISERLHRSAEANA